MEVPSALGISAFGVAAFGAPQASLLFRNIANKPGRVPKTRFALSTERKTDHARSSLGGVHHRILYFFHGAIAAVVSHGLVKERVVPPKEIDRAVERKKRFEANPAKHTYEEA